MNNKLIDSAVIAYQSGDEHAFDSLYHDWLSGYLSAFVANASSTVIGMDTEELDSLAHVVAAHAIRTWKPNAGACFKTWLCRLWRQRLCNAIHRGQSLKRVGQCQTVSLDQLMVEDGCERYELVVDCRTGDPAAILLALETVEQRLLQEGTPDGLDD